MTEEKATWDDTEKQAPSTATKGSKPIESVEPVVESVEPVVESVEPVVERVEPVVERVEPVVERVEPVVLALDESRPFGRMQNCPGVHYVQDGKLFGVDKRFVGTQQELIN